MSDSALMKSGQPYYREYLSRELAKRVDSNSRYSLRSFSKLLRISPGPLSQILSGKTSPSRKLVERIFDILEMNDLEKQQFVHSLLDEKKGLGKKRISKWIQTSFQATSKKQGIQFGEIDQENFRVIADWYHFAIWEMVERADFEFSPRFIAKKLDISIVEAKLALDRLHSQGWIKEVAGKWFKTIQRIQTKDILKTSEARRKRHLQIMKKATDAIQLVPIENRHINRSNT